MNDKEKAIICGITVVITMIKLIVQHRGQVKKRNVQSFEKCERFPENHKILGRKAKVTFAKELDEATFQGDEVFFDVLNKMWLIL